MDDPDEENVTSNWVMINSIDIAEEATILDLKSPSEENTDKSHDSDIESDGISIISESHLYESNNEEEVLNDEVLPPNENTDKSVHLIKAITKSKLNWTFVESEPDLPEVTSSNQFYLNCLQEPIQELSEHELGSAQSDSDGISIISDCESINEFPIDAQSVSHETDCDNEKIELTSKLPPGIKKYCNGVLIGTILLATTSIFLGHYFNSVEPVEEELPIYKEEFSEVSEKGSDSINEKIDVPTALAYCQELHRSNDMYMEHNVKKCLRKIENRIRRKKEIVDKKEEFKKIEKYLKIKQKYLEEKEKFLIKREYELLQAEMKLKQENFKNDKKIEKGDNVGDTTVLKKMLPEKEADINSERNKKYAGMQHKHEEIKHERPKRYKNKETNKKDRKMEYKKEKMPNFNFKDQKGRKMTKNKRVIEKMTSKERNFNTNSQQNKNPQFNNDKRKENIGKSSTNYIILENNDNQTISGYWVGKLYKARSDLRNKKHGSDWYFDRASYRKTKRDKAKWYFDWMMDRELVRYKRSFYI